MSEYSDARAKSADADMLGARARELIARAKSADMLIVRFRALIEGGQKKGAALVRAMVPAV
jgi:hypothetical protein